MIYKPCPHCQQHGITWSPDCEPQMWCYLCGWQPDREEGQATPMMEPVTSMLFGWDAQLVLRKDGHKIELEVPMRLNNTNRIELDDVAILQAITDDRAARFRRGEDVGPVCDEVAHA